jgi:hypothetical protein
MSRLLPHAAIPWCLSWNPQKVKLDCGKIIAGLYVFGHVQMPQLSNRVKFPNGNELYKKFFL